MWSFVTRFFAIRTESQTIRRGQRKKNAKRDIRSRKATYEALEERTVLTTTLYLDFGLGIGIGNVLSTTVGAIRNVAGVGLHGNGTGPDLTVGALPMSTNSSLDLRPLNYDFNGDAVINNADIEALGNAVLPVVQTALEPFDIQVSIAAGNTLANMATTLDTNDLANFGHNDAYSLVVDAHSDFYGGGSVGDNFATDGSNDSWDEVGDNQGLFGIAAADDLFSQTGNNQDELALAFADTIYNRDVALGNTPGTPAFNFKLVNRLAYTATHEAFHTFGLYHTAGTGGQSLMSDGDVIRTGSSDLARENSFIVTNADLIHTPAQSEPNNYLVIKDDSDIGLRDDDHDGKPNLAYVTGTGAFDKITLDRDASNTDLVHITVASYNDAAFLSLIQQKTYDINLITDTEGEILVDCSLSNDLINIDADIAASLRIRGMLGDDQVKLHGVGASALRQFKVDGDGGDDTFTIDYLGGDPLPLQGFNFSYTGGDGTDNTVVIDSSGVQHTGYFVDTFTDAADILVGNGRADGGAAADDQITLRAAVQEANFATTSVYIYLPAGNNLLSVAGTVSDTQGDLDIAKNITIIGTGAGETVIDASGLVTMTDRVFEVSSGATLNLIGVTVTGGRPTAATGYSGGGILVHGGGMLKLSYSAIVGNSTPADGGGGIFFEQFAGGTITNSVITNNTASNYGGGIYLAYPSPTPGLGYAAVTVTNSIIAKNAGLPGGEDIITQFNNYRPFTSGGNNRLTTAPANAGFTNNLNGDLISNTAAYVVTDVADTLNSANNNIARSLREAIQDANTGSDEIWVPGWRLGMTIPGSGGVNQGDFDITSSMTVRGVGPGETIIDATRLRPSTPDRVFEVNSSVTLNLNSITVTGGKVAAVVGGYVGGGISVHGTLNLSNSAIVGNEAYGGGGGIDFDVTGGGAIANSVVTSNSTTGFGGGIQLEAPNSGPSYPAVAVASSIIANNSATAGAPDAVAQGGYRGFTSLGNNRLTTPPLSTGFTNGVNGDLISNTATYVVTDVADTLNAANSSIALSLL